MPSPRFAQSDFGGAFSRPPRATLALMVITGVVSVVTMMDVGWGTRGALFQVLSFTPARVLDDWQVWSPFTYLFVEIQPLNLILYEIFGLWMFAAPLERSWGARRFLFYFFATATGGAVLTTALASVFPPLLPAGAAGVWVAGEAVLLAWILMNWNATVYLFFFPVRAPFLLILSVGLPLLYALMGAWQPFVTPALAMGIGYLMLKRGLSPRRAWLHFRAWRLDRELKRRSRHLRVVERDDDDRPAPPKYLN